MLRRSIRLAAFAWFPLTVIAACSREAVIADGPAPDTTGFGSADSGDQADGNVDASLPEQTLMCPVTECAFPFATCPSSTFLCDVDLLSDDENCGACGVRCGGPNLANSKWTCVDGKCTFSCAPPFRDCDGNPTNGCETTLETTENCGACGRKCAEGDECKNGWCVHGCPPDFPDECPDPESPGKTICVNLETDDENCGTCGHVCDTENGDPPYPDLPQLPSDMYYGCGFRYQTGRFECVVPKCKDRTRGDCNKDVTDGCETGLATHEHCSKCHDECTSDQICSIFPFDGPRCICQPGETLCYPNPPLGEYNFAGMCFRLDQDPENCGGCGHRCPGQDRPHFAVTCTAGACGGQCEEGFADCDGLTQNGCEIDTRIDNRNCGACGHACLPGQVCSGGECLVAPCEPEGPTAK